MLTVLGLGSMMGLKATAHIETEIRTEKAWGLWGEMGTCNQAVIREVSISWSNLSPRAMRRMLGN